MAESSVPGAVGEREEPLDPRLLRYALLDLAQLDYAYDARLDSGDYGLLERPSEFAERIAEAYARLSVNEGGPGVGEREEPFDRLALREELAALEHEQWEAWSRDVARLGLTTARRQRWARCWVPYADLDETAKDADREWADKVLAILARLSVNEGGVARTEAEPSSFFEDLFVPEAEDR